MPIGDITDYNDELIDVNNNFDPKTGVFTLTKDSENGVYKFEVSGIKSVDRGQKGEIHLFKNNDLFQKIYEGDDSNSLMMNGDFTLHLQKGDEVKLRNHKEDSIWVGIYFPFTFTGYKI